MAQIRLNFPAPISSLAYVALVLENELHVRIGDQLCSGACVMEQSDGSQPRSIRFVDVPLSNATVRNLAQDIMAAIKSRAAGGTTPIDQVPDLPDLRPSIAAGAVVLNVGGITPAGLVGK